ncbi:hypothetical protein [Wuhan insect virus 15]|uniref:Uncharacterized protein n=1 Tax=Wuhan insect virus 15 TaxID=1923719 RepID=A0A1L3KL65_9VIRU|nr:hypothetical protein [Wuhan insect virus 15]APG78076.1 hypothetical protein [Wuhan insect virus 15]
MTTTLRIASPVVNGNLEVGLAVGLDSGLPESEHLPILREKSLTEALQNVVNWLATQFPASSLTEFRLQYAGAYAIMASGLLCTRNSGGNDVPDGDWAYTSTATAPPANASQAIKDAVVNPLSSVEVADVLIGILSTKVNWWQTNHHTGQGKIQGYAAKVLTAKWPNQSQATMTTLFHRMGHWTSTIAVLRLAGIGSLKATTTVFTPSITPILSSDVKLRFDSAPAGTHKTAVAKAGAARLVRSAAAVFCPGISEFGVLVGKMRAVMADPARHHIGAAYLTGERGADFADSEAEAFLGRIGSFLRTFAPKSTLCQSPHLEAGRVSSYQDYDADFDNSCKNMKTQQIRPEVVQRAMERAAHGGNTDEELGEIRQVFATGGRD